ncbi:MAG: Ribose-phosphate pyrophosphokinae [Tardiphaga sp.]|jgi:ribose-phosphate pyrophosphokinase|nr:Ribose-phosphate pyrophosphokinae [Tardiphaga sp.]
MLMIIKAAKIGFGDIQRTANRRRPARSCTSNVPYFGYGRANRWHGTREPIMARMVADLLGVVGVDHVVTVDSHTAQIEAAA